MEDNHQKNDWIAKFRDDFRNRPYRWPKLGNQVMQDELVEKVIAWILSNVVPDSPSTQPTSEALKGEAISLLDWIAKNNYGEVGYDYEFGAKFAKFEDNVCCSDYYSPEQLYSLYIKSKQ